jgi:hypothetical protein
VFKVLEVQMSPPFRNGSMGEATPQAVATDWSSPNLNPTHRVRRSPAARLEYAALNPSLGHRKCQVK